jgi:hypothetical protein
MTERGRGVRQLACNLPTSTIALFAESCAAQVGAVQHASTSSSLPTMRDCISLRQISVTQSVSGVPRKSRCARVLLVRLLIVTVT